MDLLSCLSGEECTFRGAVGVEVSETGHGIYNDCV